MVGCKQLQEGLRLVVDLLLPVECPLCARPLWHKSWAPVCATCWQRLEMIHPPSCPRCGQPLASTAEPGDACRQCKQHPPVFDTARSVGLMSGGFRQVVHLYKYGRRSLLARPLSQLMVNRLTDGFSKPVWDGVVPVPLHGQRLKERGFNQSLLLARGIGRELGLPVFAANLVRSRATAAQTHLNRKERQKNVAGAFMVRRPQQLQGGHLLLVDDVLTTGATVNECAHVLKQAGASRVDVLTLLRAVDPDSQF